MSERLTSERLAAGRRHPAGSGWKRPSLVLLEGGRADEQADDEPASGLRERLRRAGEFIVEAFANLPEQHFT